MPVPATKKQIKEKYQPPTKEALEARAREQEGMHKKPRGRKHSKEEKAPKEERDMKPPKEKIQKPPKDDKASRFKVVRKRGHRDVDSVGTQWFTTFAKDKSYICYQTGNMLKRTLLVP